MDLLFVKRHNVCAVLNTTDLKNEDFLLVLDFLANSNISFAISHNLPVFEATIRQFWSTVTTTVINNVEHIRATIHNQEVLFTEATIREALHFNDNHEAPVDFPSYYVKECFRRLGIEMNSRADRLSRMPFHLYGHTLCMSSFTACLLEKTLSYMKSSSKRTNRVIADIPLFGHILGEEEEIIPDIDPQLQVDSSSVEEEAEQDHGNQEPDVDADQPIKQDDDPPILEAPFMDQLIENLEPESIEAEYESRNTLDEGIYGTKYDQSDYESEDKEQTEPPTSYPKRRADFESDYEQEEPLAKKVKTGLDSLTSSIESLFDIPKHLTPTHSPTHIPPPSPHPSAPHTPVTTPPASPVPDPSPSVPRVKTLSLGVKRLQEAVTKREEIKKLKTKLRESKEEIKDLRLEVGGLHTQLNVQQTQLETQQKIISQQQQEFKALSDTIEQIKASLTKSSQQETPSTAQGETTSAGGPSSPTLISNPQSTLTTFTSQATKTKDDVEVKLEETSYNLPSVSERRASRERGKGKELSVEVVFLVGPGNSTTDRTRNMTLL
ncbi:hypothetical protein L1987_09132 [Smallanthus sonchifolius]|uniref:Uncharacterized protein n=1 Tax=Smallanthus sonchifolius TaxID=185202 RepID=A0ACB9JMK0_9ASTR|nr:hypothetical protein L1987_09132 [Smallanthus sonchifolius]